MKINIRELIIAALFTALICVGAWIKVPFVPVPMTLQFFFINFAIISQKTKYSVLSVAAYICIGLIGLPVFSSGGGFLYILTPMFGYVIGFLLAALSSGIKKLKQHKLLQSLVNIVIVYVSGLIYFYLVSKLYLGADYTITWILINCCLVFIPGDLFKIFLSLTIHKHLKRIGLFGKESKIG